jgi:hypothetical protein
MFSKDTSGSNGSALRPSRIAARVELCVVAAAAAALLVAAGCGDSGDSVDASAASNPSSGQGGGAGTGGINSGTAGTGGTGGGQMKPEPEVQPEPAAGAGLSDPPTNTLQDHTCGGIDWQRIHGWLLLPHQAPEVGPTDEIQRCIDRYAGWVTNEADKANVSRASVFAGLAATGQCDAGSDYNGALVSGSQCAAVNPGLTETECLDKMAALRSFGITTLANVLGRQEALDTHARDIPLMAAFLGHGSVECGGDERWKLLAPAGFIDRYVAAYNAHKALSAELPSCQKLIVVSFALYTGLDTPGVDGVTAANGCWTYERISKSNEEWKICNYDGTVHHENGLKWTYDDTNTDHNQTTEKSRVLACAEGVPGRGYVYMTNRGNGWPKVVTEGVDVHFAEIYSGQYQVDDQFNLWKDSGAPGDPMVNLGEAATTASQIGKASLRACNEVANGGNLGVYVYPEPLRTGRMSALVEALNDCTKK